MRAGVFGMGDGVQHTKKEILAQQNTTVAPLMVF